MTAAAPKHRLGVLLSGRGSNFIAIADAIAAGTLTDCEIAVVFSNDADAPGLTAARERGLAAMAIPSRGVPRDEHDARMVAALREHSVEWVVLAGYLRVITPTFLGAFPGRVLNIHPSLLPAFPGLHAQRQALEFGAKIAGCTVHFVEEAVDAGPIILQRSVVVDDGDDEASLAARILAEEHRAYAEGIARVLSGDYELRGRRYIKHSDR